jgi:hypothetical protein
MVELSDIYQSKTTNLTIPKQTTELKTYDFSGFKNVKKITITRNVESIEKGLFKDFTFLKKVYFVRDSRVEILPQEVFANCRNLSDIVLPSCLITISANAFLNCINLLSITIPESVKIIHEDAFKGMTTCQNINVFKDYGKLNSAASINFQNPNQESTYKINKSAQRRYFAVVCKCGHVGSDRFIPITFAIIAKNRKEASEIASKMPRVKKNHKFRIISNTEIDYQSYLRLKKKNDEDPYLNIKSKSQQRKIANQINQRTMKEDKDSKSNKTVSSGKKHFDGKEEIRNFRKYHKHHPKK